MNEEHAGMSWEDEEQNEKKVWDSLDMNTQIAVTAYVFRKLVEHAKEGGTFRYLIYDRLGFDTRAYVPLYMAGGMDISNEFEIGGDRD